MIIDCPFNIGETVYYVGTLKMSHKYQVEQGKIDGVHLLYRNGENDIRVDFKGKDNGVPISVVFKDKEEADKCKNRLQGKLNEMLEK
jgi:hypothetical protein